MLDWLADTLMGAGLIAILGICLFAYLSWCGPKGGR